MCDEPLIIVAPLAVAAAVWLAWEYRGWFREWLGL